MTREKAITLLRKIKTECERHKKCDKCHFYHNGVKWCICDGQPFDWDIPEEGKAK